MRYHLDAVLSFPYTVSQNWLLPFTPDDGIYKAGKKRSEMRGAAEVQEDEDTQTEVPVDQVISKVWIKGSGLNICTFTLVLHALDVYWCDILGSSGKKIMKLVFPNAGIAEEKI